LDEGKLLEGDCWRGKMNCWREKDCWGKRITEEKWIAEGELLKGNC
jgi:hypothetical protein